MADGRKPESLPIGNTAQEKGLSHVPEASKVSPSRHPSLAPELDSVHRIDMARLRQGGDGRSLVIQEITEACTSRGFFQVVNHGISQKVMDEAMETASGFFKLPREEKAKLASNNVYEPVRYGSSLRDGEDKVQFWRVFLKHYANPLSQWIHRWPQNPPLYREKMGKYSLEVQKLGVELMEATTESLGLAPSYISPRLEQGMQVMAVNCYPPCPNPALALGLPPHSDYSCMTIVHQNALGLEILDSGTWRLVPLLPGALQVHVGNHLELLSNGRYKSVVHRVTLNRERMRISIASLHSLGFDEKVTVAEEFVDEEHPERYRASSYKDFLDFLANNDLSQGKNFIDTLRM